MNKTFFLILGILLVLPLIFAQTYQKETVIDLKFPFEVNGSAASSSATCNVSINYPNGTYLKENASMTNRNNGDFNITLSATETVPLGDYEWRAFCCDGTNCAVGYGSFKITYTGKELDSGKSILYVGFLSLLVLIFFLNFYGMGFLPARNQRNEEGRIMSISYLKYFRNVLWMTGYFLFIGIIFIASNLAFAFLEEELFAKTLFMIYRVSFGLAPVGHYTFP